MFLVSDAKTGQVIANVEKTVSTNEKGEETKNVQIDMPTVGVHEVSSLNGLVSWHISDTSTYFLTVSGIGRRKSWQFWCMCNYTVLQYYWNHETFF